MGIKTNFHANISDGLTSNLDLDLAAHGASFLVGKIIRNVYFEPSLLSSFLSDGFDTSSSAISSALKELGDNKDCQQKLRDEIDNLMPNEEDFNYDNIMSLPYLDQVWHGNSKI